MNKEKTCVLPRNTIEEQIQVLRALENGVPVEACSIFAGIERWEDVTPNTKYLESYGWHYRIKRTKVYVNIYAGSHNAKYHSGTVFLSKQEAEEHHKRDGFVCMIEGELP